MPWGGDKPDDKGEPGGGFSDGDGDGGPDLVRILPPVLIGALLVVFALANTDSVEVNFLVTTTEAPLILVLVATAVLGAVIGWFVRFLRRR